MEATHTHSGNPKLIGKIVMLVAIVGGFWLVWTLQEQGKTHLPGWATNLIILVVGLLMGGTSTLVPERRGGRAATYTAFVLFAIAMIMMVVNLFVHAGGK